jgi:hypothetical protein
MAPKRRQWPQDKTIRDSPPWLEHPAWHDPQAPRPHLPEPGDENLTAAARALTIPDD